MKIESQKIKGIKFVLPSFQSILGKKKTFDQKKTIHPRLTTKLGLINSIFHFINV
jgi:hypothetical protein